MSREVVVRVPEGERGPWRVEQFTLAAEHRPLNPFSFSSGGRGYIPAGTYTQLLRKGSVVMSDTPDEIRDLRDLLYHAKGRVLLNGLGLGVALQGCLNKPEVEHVDVVEVDADVVALVAPHYEGPRVSVHQGDALTFPWPKGTRWNVVWHDIWDGICADNLEVMHRLHRRYGRRCDWQGSWCRWQCEDQARRY